MNNPPAFPHAAAFQGMSLRDYFAAKAMQGIYASNAKHDHADDQIFDAVAEAAYLQADAMLAAREKA